MSPVLPDEVSNIISDPTATLCGNFKNTLLRFPALFYEWFKWAFTSGGSVSNAFKREIRYTGDLIFSAAPLAEDDSRLLCNGQDVVRATYPELFALIGTTYGAGNGSTTFGLPDYRDKFPRGVGANPIGTEFGSDEVTLILANIPPHKHANPDDQSPVAVDKASGGGGIGLDFSGGGTVKATDWTADAGGSGSPKVAQPFDIVPASVACFVYIAT